MTIFSSRALENSTFRNPGGAGTVAVASKCTSQATVATAIAPPSPQAPQRFRRRRGLHDFSARIFGTENRRSSPRKANQCGKLAQGASPLYEARRSRAPQTGAFTRNALSRELLDRFVEQLVEIQLDAQVQEKQRRARSPPDRMKTNSRGTFTGPSASSAVDGHGRPRGGHYSGWLHAVGNGAHAIVEQRRIDEAGPDVRYVDRDRATVSGNPSPQ